MWSDADFPFSIFHFPFSVMLLAIDIGNSSIKFGIFESESLVEKLRIPTRRDHALHELLFDTLRYIKQHYSRIDKVAVSSVVIELDSALRQACEEVLTVTPVFIDHAFNFGIQVNYDPVTAVGTDRLVNAATAVEKYGMPVIVCSFGTATTIDVVNSDGEYLGGSIAPGMNTLAEALHLKTSKLPHIVIEKPASVIGHTTIGSIQSGVFYGYIGLFEGIIIRMFDELSDRPVVVATGGFAKLISENCDLINTIDENLTLDGLRLLLEKQRPKVYIEALDS